MASNKVVIQNKIFTINYEIINIDKQDNIIFLHGWGSNKEIMKQAFKNQFKNHKHIYIDMPGFGKSDNQYELTTQQYKDIIKKFLDKLDINIDIVVGHSFGGKVATLLKPKMLVLLSSAGILELKSAKTLLTIRMAKIFNKFGLQKVTKLLRSKDVDMMSQNMYETFKNVVDEDFSTSFKNYKGKTLIFWGQNDTATTIQSGKTIHQYIKNSDFKVYNGDHYFFLQNYNDISQRIQNSWKN